MKPKTRSLLRVKAGTVYYRIKRYIKWYFGKQKFATKKENTPLPYCIFTHSTPLYRKLKNVDMWLQQNKVKNIEIALKKLDGILILPGETFSYWKNIGKPTRHKGYVEGMVLYYGSFKTGIGGGLCQLSNLIYWCTLHSPLKVVERHRHSFDVFPDSNRTQPFRSGATCAYNYLDLQIYNATNNPYQLKLYLTDNKLMAEWRSNTCPNLQFHVYEKKHWITHEHWGGYLRHNLIYRKAFDLDNNLLADEYITENHAIMMYNPLLENPNKNNV
ncbi:VanW family protein [Alkaliphilus pronyensis]|uniref:VanW family protein n=1 Tax=Alkaliphilus pronyensis TaxID=1482732 RepID=A0A6I0FA76_9FIRM|nr:VanW family protein [Alkaliphilus pronyensis]KAB3534387.1 VanW family protein [Alkaliphilus pronyensis]